MTKIIANEVRAEMMRAVADGQTSLGVLLWHMNQMTRCDEILAWLLKNNVTGYELLGFMRFKCGNGILSTIKEITRRIDSDKEASAILVGRDYRPA